MARKSSRRRRPLQRAVDASASFGRFSATVSAVLATLFAAILIVMGAVVIASIDGGGLPGGVMIAFGVLVLVIAWTWRYATRRSRTFAALSGASSFLSLLSNSSLVVK
jgi:hypothetical protein